MIENYQILLFFQFKMWLDAKIVNKCQFNLDIPTFAPWASSTKIHLVCETLLKSPLKRILTVNLRRSREVNLKIEVSHMKLKGNYFVKLTVCRLGI